MFFKRIENQIPPIKLNTTQLTSFKRQIYNLIAFAIEQPVIFHTIIITYSLLVAVLYEFIKSPPFHLFIALFLKVLIILVPGAFVIQVYLLNLTRARRASLSVRFRRHDDTLVLSLLAQQILRAIIYSNRPINRLSRLLKRAPTEEKIRSRCLYLTCLFDEVANHFKVSRDVIEEIIGTPVKVLTIRLENLLEINLLRAACPPDKERFELLTSELESEAKLLNIYINDLGKHLNKLLTLFPIIPIVLHRIVKEPSTGKTANIAGEILARYLIDKQSHRIIKQLLSLRRGLPFHSLFRFEEFVQAIDQKQIPSRDVEIYYKHFKVLSSESTSTLGRNAAEFISKDLDTEELIITFGYSNAVVGVIKELSSHEKTSDLQIVVIEPEQLSDWERIIFEEEGKLMETRLKEIPDFRGKVMRDNIHSFLEKKLQDRMTRIFIGAENIRNNGMVIHPRGRRSLHMDAVNNRDKNFEICKVYVFAESYKFIELGEEVYALPYFVTFAPTEYNFIITESKIIATDENGSLYDAFTGNPINLSTIKIYWETSADEFLIRNNFKPIFKHLKT